MLVDLLKHGRNPHRWHRLFILVMICVTVHKKKIIMQTFSRSWKHEFYGCWSSIQRDKNCPEAFWILSAAEESCSPEDGDHSNIVPDKNPPPEQQRQSKLTYKQALWMREACRVNMSTFEILRPNANMLKICWSAKEHRHRLKHTSAFPEFNSRDFKLGERWMMCERRNPADARRQQTATNWNCVFFDLPSLPGGLLSLTQEYWLRRGSPALSLMQIREQGLW